MSDVKNSVFYVRYRVIKTCKPTDVMRLLGELRKLASKTPPDVITVIYGNQESGINLIAVSPNEVLVLRVEPRVSKDLFKALYKVVHDLGDTVEEMNELSRAIERSGCLHVSAVETRTTIDIICTDVWFDVTGWLAILTDPRNWGTLNYIILPTLHKLGFQVTPQLLRSM